MLIQNTKEMSILGFLEMKPTCEWFNYFSRLSKLLKLAWNCNMQIRMVWLSVSSTKVESPCASFAVNPCNLHSEALLVLKTIKGIYCPKSKKLNQAVKNQNSGAVLINMNDLLFRITLYQQHLWVLFQSCQLIVFMLQVLF